MAANPKLMETAFLEEEDVTTYSYPEDMELPNFAEPVVFDRTEAANKAFWTSALSDDIDSIIPTYNTVFSDFELRGKSSLYDNAVQSWVKEQEPLNTEIVAAKLEDPNLTYDVKQDLIKGFEQDLYTSTDLKDAFVEKTIANREVTETTAWRDEYQKIVDANTAQLLRNKEDKSWGEIAIAFMEAMSFHSQNTNLAALTEWDKEQKENPQSNYFSVMLKALIHGEETIPENYVYPGEKLSKFFKGFQGEIMGGGEFVVQMAKFAWIMSTTATDFHREIISGLKGVPNYDSATAAWKDIWQNAHEDYMYVPDESGFGKGLLNMTDDLTISDRAKKASILAVADAMGLGDEVRGSTGMWLLNSIGEIFHTTTDVIHKSTGWDRDVIEGVLGATLLFRGGKGAIAKRLDARKKLIDKETQADWIFDVDVVNPFTGKITRQQLQWKPEIDIEFDTFGQQVPIRIKNTQNSVVLDMDGKKVRFYRWDFDSEGNPIPKNRRTEESPWHTKEELERKIIPEQMTKEFHRYAEEWQRTHPGGTGEVMPTPFIEGSTSPVTVFPNITPIETPLLSGPKLIERKPNDTGHYSELEYQIEKSPKLIYNRKNLIEELKDFPINNEELLNEINLLPLEENFSNRKEIYDRISDSEDAVIRIDESGRIIYNRFDLSRDIPGEVEQLKHADPEKVTKEELLDFVKANRIETEIQTQNWNKPEKDVVSQMEKEVLKMERAVTGTAPEVGWTTDQLYFETEIHTDQPIGYLNIPLDKLMDPDKVGKLPIEHLHSPESYFTYRTPNENKQDFEYGELTTNTKSNMSVGRGFLLPKEVKDSFSDIIFKYLTYPGYSMGAGTHTILTRRRTDNYSSPELPEQITTFTGPGVEYARSLEPTSLIHSNINKLREEQRLVIQHYFGSLLLNTYGTDPIGGMGNPPTDLSKNHINYWERKEINLSDLIPELKDPLDIAEVEEVIDWMQRQKEAQDFEPPQLNEPIEGTTKLATFPNIEAKYPGTEIYTSIEEGDMVGVLLKNIDIAAFIKGEIIPYLWHIYQNKYLTFEPRESDTQFMQEENQFEPIGEPEPQHEIPSQAQKYALRFEPKGSEHIGTDGEMSIDDAHDGNYHFIKNLLAENENLTEIKVQADVLARELGILEVSQETSLSSDVEHYEHITYELSDKFLERALKNIETASINFRMPEDEHIGESDRLFPAGGILEALDEGHRHHLTTLDEYDPTINNDIIGLRNLGTKLKKPKIDLPDSHIAVSNALSFDRVSLIKNVSTDKGSKGVVGYSNEMQNDLRTETLKIQNAMNKASSKEEFRSILDTANWDPTRTADPYTPWISHKSSSDWVRNQMRHSIYNLYKDGVDFYAIAPAIEPIQRWYLNMGWSNNPGLMISTINRFNPEEEHLFIRGMPWFKNAAHYIKVKDNIMSFKREYDGTNFNVLKKIAESLGTEIIQIDVPAFKNYDLIMMEYLSWSPLAQIIHEGNYGFKSWKELHNQFEYGNTNGSGATKVRNYDTLVNSRNRAIIPNLIGDKIYTPEQWKANINAMRKDLKKNAGKRWAIDLKKAGPFIDEGMPYFGKKKSDDIAQSVEAKTHIRTNTSPTIGLDPESNFTKLYLTDPQLAKQMLLEMRGDPEKFLEAFGEDIYKLHMEFFMPKEPLGMLTPAEQQENIMDNRAMPLDTIDSLPNEYMRAQTNNMIRFDAMHTLPDSLYDKQKVMFDLMTNAKVLESVLGYHNKNRFAYYIVFDPKTLRHRLISDMVFQKSKTEPFSNKKEAFEAAKKLHYLQTSWQRTIIKTPRGNEVIHDWNKAGLQEEGTDIFLKNLRTNVMEKFDPTMSLKEDTLNLAESPWVVVRSGNEPIPNVKSQELFDTMAPENFKVLGILDVYEKFGVSFISNMFTQGLLSEPVERILLAQDLYKEFELAQFFKPIAELYTSSSKEVQKSFDRLTLLKQELGLDRIDIHNVERKFPNLLPNEVNDVMKLDQLDRHLQDKVFEFLNSNKRNELWREGYQKAIEIEGSISDMYIKEDILPTNTYKYLIPTTANLERGERSRQLIIQYPREMIMQDYFEKVGDKALDKEGRQAVRLYKEKEILVGEEYEVIDVETGTSYIETARNQIRLQHAIIDPTLSKISEVNINQIVNIIPLPQKVVHRLPGHFNLTFKGQTHKIVSTPLEADINGSLLELKFDKDGNIDLNASDTLLNSGARKIRGMYGDLRKAEKALKQMKLEQERLREVVNTEPVELLHFEIEKVQENIQAITDAHTLHAESLSTLERVKDYELEGVDIVNPLKAMAEVEASVLEVFMNNSYLEPIKGYFMKEYGQWVISFDENGNKVFPRKINDYITQTDDISGSLKKNKTGFIALQKILRMQNRDSGKTAEWIEGAWRLASRLSETDLPIINKVSKATDWAAGTAAEQANLARKTTSVLFISMNWPWKHWFLQALPFYEMLLAPTWRTVEIDGKKTRIGGPGIMAWKALVTTMPQLFTYMFSKDVAYNDQYQYMKSFMSHKDNGNRKSPEEIEFFNEILTIGELSVSQSPELANMRKAAEAIAEMENDISLGLMSIKDATVKFYKLWKKAGFVSGELINKAGHLGIIAEEWKSMNPGKNMATDTVKFTDNAGRTYKESPEERKLRFVDAMQRNTHNMTKLGTPEYMYWAGMPTLAQFMLIMQKLAVEPMQTNFSPNIRGIHKGVRMIARVPLYGASGLYYLTDYPLTWIVAGLYLMYNQDEDQLTEQEKNEIANIKNIEETLKGFVPLSDIVATAFTRGLVYVSGYDDTIFDDEIDYTNIEEVTLVSKWFTPFGLQRDQIWVIPMMQGLLTGETDENMFSHASANANSRILRFIKDTAHFLKEKDIKDMTTDDMIVFFKSIAKLSSGGSNYLKMRTCISLFNIDKRGDFETNTGFRKGLALNKSQCYGKLLGGTSTEEDNLRKMQELQVSHRKDIKKEIEGLTDYLVTYHQEWLSNRAGQQRLEVEIELSDILKNHFALMKADPLFDTDDIMEIKKGLVLNAGKIYDSKTNDQNTVLMKLIQSILLDDFVKDISEMEQQAVDLINQLPPDMRLEFIKKQIEWQKEHRKVFKEQLKRDREETE